MATSRSFGHVRSFKGTWGFVVSDAFDGDLFIGLKGNPHLTALHEGDQIEFEVQTNPGGKAEAINVVVVSSNSGVTDGIRHSGVVRSFKETWGFIRSDDFEGDLFVGLKLNPKLNVLSPDDQVTFEIKQNPDGKSEAVNVELVTYRPNMISTSTTPGGPVVRAQVPHLVGQHLTGRIKNYKDTWGFVNSDSFVGDLFVHKKSSPNLGEVGAGDAVEFDVTEDLQSPGNYQAINAVVMKEDFESLVGMVIKGVVKSFQGGWGFINSPRFNGDLFVGAKVNPQLVSAPLQQGEKVEFQVARDSKASGVTYHAIRVQRVQLPLGALVGQSFVPIMPMPMPTVSVAHKQNGFVHSQLRAIAAAMGIHVPDGPASPPGAMYSSVQRAAPCGGISPVGSPLALLGQTVIGEIRSFKGEFGFAISSVYAGDVFIGLKSNPHLTQPLQKGHQIQFMVAKNGTKVEGVQVQVVGFGTGDVGGALGARDRSRSPTMFTMLPAVPQARRGLSSLAPGRDPAGMIGQTFFGTIRSFKGNWGFVTSSSYDGDVFVGKNSNKHLTRELMQGEHIQFEISRSSQGKLEAVNVQVTS